MPTTIEWTEETWNPTRGCSLASPGCTNCYAMLQANRFSGPGGAYEGLTKLRKKNGPVWTGEIRLVKGMLDQPKRWREPRTIFVNSMSDLFHEKLTDAEIGDVFEVMRTVDRHTYQVLTKRAQRLAAWTTGRDWLARAPHIWLGVSVEDRKHGVPRIDELRKATAAVRFLSIEPLLEDLGTVDFSGIDWVIVGGESGPHARLMEKKWVRSLRDQCVRAGVAFFFKQWGGVRKKTTGRTLDGRTWDQYPQLELATGT